MKNVAMETEYKWAGWNLAEFKFLRLYDVDNHNDYGRIFSFIALERKSENKEYT